MNLPFRVVTPRNIYYCYCDFFEGRDEKGYPRSYYNMRIYDKHPQAGRKPWQLDNDPIWEFGTIPAKETPPTLLAKRVIEELEIEFEYAEKLAMTNNVIRLKGAENIPVDSEPIEQETVVSDWATGETDVMKWEHIPKIIKRGKNKKKAAK